MKKPSRLASAIVVLLSLQGSGCSSLRARSEILGESWTLYPGVQQDLVDIDNLYSGKLQANAVVLPILYIDLPFSAIFDTVVLPYDLYRTNF